MAQQLVIQNGFVAATHTLEQDLAGKYPGCTIVAWDGPRVLPCDEAGNPTPDPRTFAEQTADTRAATIAALQASHAQAAEQGVTLANGWRLRYAEDATANYLRLKSLIDLAGSELAQVTLIDADSQPHTLTPAEALAVLKEYALLSAVRIQQQYSELLAAGW